MNKDVQPLWDKATGHIWVTLRPKRSPQYRWDGNKLARVSLSAMQAFLSDARPGDTVAIGPYLVRVLDYDPLRQEYLCLQLHALLLLRQLWSRFVHPRKTQPLN